MKITKISISDFHQFQNFELDLTYPKGHDKVGKPLDKVCFIGQSGTGKTTILEMIRAAALMSTQYRLINRPNTFDFKPKEGAIFKFEEKDKEDFSISLNHGGAAQMTHDLEIPPFQNVFYFTAGLSFSKLFKNEKTTPDVTYVQEPQIGYQRKITINDFQIV